MQQQVSPGAVIVVIIAMVLVIGAAFYFALHGKDVGGPGGKADVAPAQAAPATPTTRPAMPSPKQGSP